MPVVESLDFEKDIKKQKDFERKVKMMEAENERLRLELERMNLKRSTIKMQPMRSIQKDISSSVSDAVNSFGAALYNSFVRLLKSCLILCINFAIVGYTISPIDFYARNAD